MEGAGSIVNSLMGAHDKRELGFAHTRAAHEQRSLTRQVKRHAEVYCDLEIPAP